MVASSSPGLSPDQTFRSSIPNRSRAVGWDTCYLAALLLIAITALGMIFMGVNFILVTRPRRWTRKDEKAEARLLQRLDRDCGND